MSSQSESVWFVQLPAKYKEVFDKMAKEEGDTSHGAGARQVRKFLKKTLNGEAE